jgi:putative peptide zinc metalloprotease protein
LPKRHQDSVQSQPATVAYDLVLADGTRLPLTGNVTIGRGGENTLPVRDPAVSRRHAGITLGGDGPLIHDLGSSYGTWVDGERIGKPTKLADGSRIRLGNQSMVVERRRSPYESGLTMIVPPAPRDVRTPDGERFGARPRLREGSAVKRLAASEGSRRYVLKDGQSGSRVRLSGDDHRLLELLDGNRTLPDLVVEAKRRFGPDGAGRLTRLLAELASRGFLADVGAEPTQPSARGLFRVRERHWDSAGTVFVRIYSMGGRYLLAPPLLVLEAVIMVLGLCAFPYLVLARYGTPFVVVHHVGLGGLVFVAGRLVIGAAHETAHGLVLASFGRRVATAGVKLVLIFPYFFVDTSDAWFENRRRRIAVSAAGPASDLILGGIFSLCSLKFSAGAVRDVLFQLAFGAYLGALFNLNPFLERDGYHILVDMLGEPGLRGRAQAELRQVLSGRAPARVGLLIRYALFGLAWSVAAGVIGVVMSLRYEPSLARILPAPIAWGLLAACWVVAFMPVLLVVAPPLVRRARLPAV